MVKLEPTLSALTRLRGFLRSSGRYGPSPFLIGHYGGLGEIAQGFCRAAAVAGAVYILGRPSLSASPPSPANGSKYTFDLDEVPEPLTADIVLTAPDMLPESLEDDAPPAATGPGSAVARGIIVLDRRLPFPKSAQPSRSIEEEDPSEDQEQPPSGAVDTAVVVFPPGTVPNGSASAAANAFVTGQGTMSAPVGKCAHTYIYHLSATLA
jgi:hypothetical protein